MAINYHQDMDDDETIQRNGTSLDMLFDIEESIVDNLEDFIYLARLGCIEEAQAVYDECLAPYQDQFFTILAEYAAMLLEIGANVEVQELLPETRIKYSGRYEKLLKDIASLAKAMATNFDKPVVRRTLNEPEPLLPGLKALVNDLVKAAHATQDSFDGVEFQSLIMRVSHLAVDHPDDVDWYLTRYYSILCERLCSISRFWEARQLLLPNMSSSRPSDRVNVFRLFFKYCGTYASQQPAKIALLASQIDYLSFAAREHLTPYDKEKILDEADNLLRYFFESPSDAKGRLYEEWKKLSYIEPEPPRIYFPPSPRQGYSPPEPRRGVSLPGSLQVYPPPPLPPSSRSSSNIVKVYREDTDDSGILTPSPDKPIIPATLKKEDLLARISLSDKKKHAARDSSRP